MDKQENVNMADAAF